MPSFLVAGHLKRLPASTHTSTGGRSYRRGRGKESRASGFVWVPVYNPLTGDVYKLPAETIVAVDGFQVPAGFWGKWTREASLMYLIGVDVQFMSTGHLTV